MRANIKRTGVTLAELVGVFTMICVLGAAITPQLRQSREANKLSKLRFNLQKLRKRISDYRHRTGRPPAELSAVFDAAIEPIPENPACDAPPGLRNRVKKIEADPPTDQNVSVDFGGWLYNPKTGGVWADHGHYLSE